MWHWSINPNSIWLSLLPTILIHIIYFIFSYRLADTIWKDICSLHCIRASILVFSHIFHLLLLSSSIQLQPPKSVGNRSFILGCTHAFLSYSHKTAEYKHLIEICSFHFILESRDHLIIMKAFLCVVRSLGIHCVCSLTVFIPLSEVKHIDLLVIMLGLWILILWVTVWFCFDNIELYLDENFQIWDRKQDCLYNYYKLCLHIFPMFYYHMSWSNQL